MFTLNEVTLMGRLGSDAKIHTAANGKKYASISLATEDVARDEEGGWIITPVWHDLLVFPSEGILPHLTKGACVLVKATVSYRTEENSNRKLMNLRVRQLQVQMSGGSSSRNREQRDNASEVSGSFRRGESYPRRRSQNAQGVQPGSQEERSTEEDFV